MSPRNETELHIDSDESQVRRTWMRGAYPLAALSKNERMYTICPLFRFRKGSTDFC